MSGGEEIRVSNTIDELETIYDGLSRFIETAGLPETLRGTLFLVVEELFSNIVRYGYATDADDTIIISVVRDGEFLRLTIRDHAAEFDASILPGPPDFEVDLESKEIGGLGLYLVHEFAHSVESRRDGAANVTVVQLPIAKAV